MFNSKASGNAESVLTASVTGAASPLHGISAVRLNAKLDARYHRNIA